MSRDAWFPKGYKLTDGSIISSFLFSGENWQIFDTQGVRTILLAHPELAAKWCKAGLLEDSLLGTEAFGTKSFRSLCCQKKYTLAPVEGGKSPSNKTDALAFSLALKESRRLSANASFHDSIYAEQYSRLLPTWTLTPHVEDEMVLGTWITGGVAISTKSFRRLQNLAGWMSPADLAEIVEAADFQVLASASILGRPKPDSQMSSEEKDAAVESDEHSETLRHPKAKTKPGSFSLPGRPQLEDFFNEHVIDIIFNPEKYQVLGIDFPSAIVLHGPPGCGKTFAVERLVEFIDWPNYSINSNSVGSPYIHETSKKISGVFDKAIDNAPSVIIIDEMESFLSDRQLGATPGHLHHVEEVAEFLRRIPEALKNKVLIIAMTNMIDLIDPAILRRGRFDHVIEVGMPTTIEVMSLLDSLLCKLPKSKDIDLKVIVNALTGKPLSDSAFVIREAARHAAKSGKKQIDQESIATALHSLPEKKDKKAKHIGFGSDS